MLTTEELRAYKLAYQVDNSAFCKKLNIAEVFASLTPPADSINKAELNVLLLT